MTSEEILPVSPEVTARLARITIAALAEDHIIMPKDEFDALMKTTIHQHTVETFDLLTETYHQTGTELVGHLSEERLKGYEFGGKVLERMRSIITEEYSEAFGQNNAPE